MLSNPGQPCAMLAPYDLPISGHLPSFLGSTGSPPAFFCKWVSWLQARASFSAVSIPKQCCAGDLGSCAPSVNVHMCIGVWLVHWIFTLGLLAKFLGSYIWVLMETTALARMQAFLEVWVSWRPWSFTAPTGVIGSYKSHVSLGQRCLYSW